MLRDLPSSGQHTLPPDPKGTAGVFRRVGYKLDDALADIIDNSIDAAASAVLVRFVRSGVRLVRVIVVDDGHGMTESKLDEVMRYGVQEEHKQADLGKYGIGLKSASFSQCESLTVVSRKGGETSGRRWTLTSIANDWTVEEVDTGAATRFYSQDWGELANRRSGTVVVWDDLELSIPPNVDFEKALAALMKDLTVGLGLRFHRFIQDGRLSIRLDVQSQSNGQLGIPLPVRPLDPFGYKQSGRKGFPARFVVGIQDLGSLTLLAHIWPAKSKDVNYKLGGGNVAGRQGFYFYRNGRLIQAGGWNRYQKSDHEPHLSLARVEIDLPPEYDSAFKLSIQKSAVEPPRAFLEALRDAYSGPMAFHQYLDLADETYRNAGPDKDYGFLFPGNGIPWAAAKRIRRGLEERWEGDGSEVSFEWSPLANNVFFDIRRDPKVITLNKRYRDRVTGGTNTKTDAPIIKLLLFFLAEDALLKDRLSSVQKGRLEEINAALIQVLMDGE